jgi:L-threonylcarbamoyladenylate synthase
MTRPQFLSICSAEAIQKAAEQLKAGHLVAFPTETVYGLGADATNKEAVKRIYEAKGRPSNHPLIVHVSSINTLEVWAQNISDYAVDLARTFWPGPMTLILKRSRVAEDFITGSQDSVGIRVPSHPIAIALLTKFETLGGLGVAAPSANRFGHVSPTSAQDVHVELGDYLSENDLILEGGKSEVGIESTIIDCRHSKPIILRPGKITVAMINSVVKVESINMEHPQFRVSGNLEKHYAPITKVILNKTPKSGQAYIALSSFQTPEGVYRISAPANVDEFARNLYAGMRRADELGFAELVIEIPEGQGIEVALLDRLTKAAQGR